MPFTTIDVPCACCKQYIETVINLAEPRPDSQLCACCLKGLAVISQNSDLEWVKVAQLNLPAKLQRFIMLRSDDNDMIEMLRANGQSFHHGDVFEVDAIEVSTPHEGTADIKGKTARRISDGMPGFVVSAVQLHQPDIQQLFAQLTPPNPTEDE